MTATTQDAVDRYLTFWNAAPDDQRRTGHDTFTVDVTYTAADFEMTGVDELAGFTDRFAGHVGSYEFRPRTQPQTHHGRARVQWEIRVGDAVFAEGTDVLTLTDDGRIAAVTAFVDRLPAAAPHH